MKNEEIDVTRNLIAEILLIPVDSIHPDDELSKLKNIDSLSFEMIIIALEDKIGKSIDPMKIFEIKTVADLAKLL